MSQWRLRRLYHVEAAFFRLRLVDLDEEIEDDYDNKLTPIEQLALVAHNDRGKSSTLDNLSRLEARLERSFYKALREIERLRAQRPEKNENQTQSHDRTPPLGSQNTPYLVRPSEPETTPEPTDSRVDPLVRGRRPRRPSRHASIFHTLHELRRYNSNLDPHLDHQSCH